MAKQKGHRANKPNDTKGTVDDEQLYKGKYRDEVYQEEEEIETKPEEKSVDPVKEETATQSIGESFVENKKDHDYKKRYDDLKRHYDEKVNEWKKLNQEKETKPVSNTSPQMSEFRDKYPDVYSAVEEISSSKAESQISSLKDEIETLKSKEKNLQKEKAYEELLRLQPNFDTLKADEKFLTWLQKQPSSIADGIYKNNLDAQWASRVVDLYIADTGKSKREVKKADDAAASVQNTQAREVSTDGNNKKVWKASEIQKMKSWDFEKYEKEIDQARSEGRIDFSS